MIEVMFSFAVGPGPRGDLGTGEGMDGQIEYSCGKSLAAEVVDVIDGDGMISGRVPGYDGEVVTGPGAGGKGSAGNVPGVVGVTGSGFIPVV